MTVSSRSSISNAYSQVVGFGGSGLSRDTAMKQFQPLTVERITRETVDSVRIALSVPAELADEYKFLPGQHLPFQVVIDGRKVRRTYSICSARDERLLEIGIREQPGGCFAGFAVSALAPGDTLEAMPPAGQFHLDLDEHHEKTYAGFAAGSGITPILSMVRSVLTVEPLSRFVLFYGNRKQSTTMFIEDLFALKNLYPDRLQLHFIFSQEEQEFPIASGRIDQDKVCELVHHFCKGIEIDDAYVCGPDTMIGDVSRALADLGINAEHVHFERFGAPRKLARQAAHKGTGAEQTTITVIMDGHRKSFEMHRDDPNIVDAAAGQGIDLPYSCKGGVCATCRCHVRNGEVMMATNYGLEPWEVEQGFVLACQSRPVSAAVTLDYDKT